MSKNVVSRRTLSVHKEHELLTKLEREGLSEKEAQLVIESKGNILAKEIVELIRQKADLTLPKFLRDLKMETEKVLCQKFGKSIVTDKFPPEFTTENLKKWKKMNFHPIFLPAEEISQNRRLKNWTKPEDWFYQKIREGKIAKDSARLKKGWYLADFSLGANYTDGTQVFPNDSLAPIIQKLREQGKIGKYDNTPMGSRFAIIPQNEWPLVCQALLKELGIKNATCRLERAIEFNAIGNLYDSNRGRFNMWEWFADDFGGADRLCGGGRDYGGLADVLYFWSGDRSGFVAGRPLVSFA